MNCQEFWNGDAEATDHWKECPACARRLESNRRLAAGLTALGAAMRYVEAPTRLERRLIAAYRGRTLLRPLPPRGAWWIAGVWAAGLAITTGFALFLVRPHEPTQTHKVTRHLTQSAAVDAAPGRESFDTWNDFLPLPNADRIEPNEPVNLVRLELPRSAMAAFGLTVAQDRAPERIAVDVALGADGTARAVRFLDAEMDLNSKEVSW